MCRYLQLEPTGSDAWRRERLGWRLVHASGREVFFAGVRHVPHDKLAQGIHTVMLAREAVVMAHAAAWRFLPDHKRGW